MEISSKKLERTSRIVYFVISLLLCLFLILLTNKLIEDVDNFKVAPDWSSFEDNTVTQKIDKEIAILKNKIDLNNNKRSQIEKTIIVAQQNRESEKESFDNWLKTRKIIGSPENDIEVLERARKIDDLLSIEQQWQKQLAAIDDSIAVLNKKIDVSYQKIDIERAKTSELYYEAKRVYDTSVFLLRLLLVSPILILGIWFAVKFRKNKYWPLFRGFSFYSLYAFFLGLVPYFPSYGGYIRYTVGVLLSLFAGYYAINMIKKYLDAKKLELEISSTERAKKVETDTAEKALMNHVCPSCGKDFILKNWETGIDNKAIMVTTDFCRYCGLELFAKCGKCGKQNFVHLPFCTSCGVKLKESNV